MKPVHTFTAFAEELNNFCFWVAFRVVKGRDEKGCKMDVDRRRHVDRHSRASTVDGLEKCSLVDVDL